MKYKFQLATAEDIEEIAAIEAEHFRGTSLETTPYSSEDLNKWYQKNNKMFYVVKVDAASEDGADKDFGVVAYVIFMPVTDLCYDRLRKDEINDPRMFEDCDILSSDVPEDEIDYYYTASIAFKPEFSKSMRVSFPLMTGIANFFKERGKAVITTPVTDEGLILTKKMFYKPVNGEGGLKKNYELNLVELRKEKRFSTLTRRRKQEPNSENV